MSDNGGEISVGQRLSRIEKRLDIIEKQLDDRITRHREANQQAIKELATSVIEDIGRRVTTLEKHDVADEAVRSYRKWLIGVGLVGIGGLLINFFMLLQVLGKV